MKDGAARRLSASGPQGSTTRLSARVADVHLYPIGQPHPTANSEFAVESANRVTCYSTSALPRKMAHFDFNLRQSWVMRTIAINPCFGLHLD